jgi:hypothetical protein
MKQWFLYLVLLSVFPAALAQPSYRSEIAFGINGTFSEAFAAVGGLLTAQLATLTLQLGVTGFF